MQPHQDRQFVNRKITLSRDVMLKLIESGQLDLPFTSFCLISRVPQYPEMDAILKVTSRTWHQDFALFCSLRSTPQSITTQMSRATRVAKIHALTPMILAPYLSEDILIYLEKEQISGVDLSGNGFILAPNFTIWKSGNPNRYPDSQPIKNLYHGVSSCFVRALLLRGQFDSLKELQEYTLAHLYNTVDPKISTARLSMGTASKVIQQLEEQSLIRRNGRVVQVVGAEDMMNGLLYNYTPPSECQISGIIDYPISEIQSRLTIDRHQMTDSSKGIKFISTGIGSASRYKLLSGIDRTSLYVNNLDLALDLLNIKPTKVFPNIELIEEHNDMVYFDPRRDPDMIWASPIQTWIELKMGGPREKEAAALLEEALANSSGEHIK